MYYCFKSKLNVVAWCLFTVDSSRNFGKIVIQIDVMNSRTDPKHKFKTPFIFYPKNEIPGIILQNLEKVISIIS